MKQLFITILLIAGLITGVVMAKPEVAPTLAQNPVSQLVKQVNAPRTLVIPKLEMNAYIESVGNDNYGNMDVPKDPNNAGWYNRGATVGEAGNAVIAGHLDDEDGPALFYPLNTLGIGDTIQVTTTFGQSYTYKVIDKATYRTEDFPSELVFGPTKKKRLNLITCTGSFNRATQEYSHRIVVFTELQ